MGICICCEDGSDFQGEHVNSSQEEKNESWTKNVLALDYVDFIHLKLIKCKNLPEAKDWK